MRTTFVLSALAVVAPALGAPTVVPITKRAGPVKPDSYIIKFKDASSKDAFMNTKAFAQSGSSVTYNYGPLFNVIAARLLDSDLTSVQGFSGVEYIEQDGIMSLFDEEPIDELPPANQGGEALSDPLLEKRGGGGEGVTVYGLDTGIYVDHNCFGGRASWGKTFGDGYKDADGNGHGTHTAGTAVGKGFGVATGAKVVAVKVMSDDGTGSTSDIIAGIDYVVGECKYRKLCVATMSLGGAFNQGLNDAVKAAIGAGIHFTIAAGNSNVPAAGTSPANVEEANTIGAVDANNQKASFSNYGELIDVWAPGVNIVSAWIDNPDSSRMASGTSMATPYVAGVLALALGKEGHKSPAELSKMLNDHAKDAVTFAATDTLASTTSTHKLVQVW